MLHADTQRLTRASLELSSRDQRRRRTATLATLIFTLLLAGASILFLHESDMTPWARAGDSVTEDNLALHAELERVRTELGLEKATRAELSREAGELNARINELNTRLEFLVARNSRPDQPH
ncbi:MAG: hypothetical protein ABI661_06330 [Gammaproteobacteria bacterium]